MKKTIFTLVFALASVAAMASQTFVGWGDNSHGQLTLPAGFSGGVVDVATGHGNTVLLKTDGTVIAWGYNPLGSCNVPANLSGVVKVSTFAHHCLALKGDGTVVAWGRNMDGESSVPAGLANVIGVAAGAYHSLAVKGDGTVVTWGSNYYGERDVPAGLSGVVAVTAGFCVSYAIKSDGTAVAWGLNTSGQCNIPSGLTGVIAVGAGNSHAVALKANGTVVAWGNSDDGRTSVPEGLSGVTKIAVIYDHTLALKSDGTVVAWGKTEHGECSFPSGLTGVTAIAAGAWHSVAIAGTLPPQVTVAFDSQGGNVIPDKSYNENAVYGTLSIPSKIGYTFDGWWSSITGEIIIEAAASVGTSSHTLYARWKVNAVSTNQVFVGWGDNTVSGAGSVIMGQVSFGEGNSYLVIGDTIFEAGENPGLLHPADANCDWSVDQSEVSASISRWKNAQENVKTAVAIRGITLYLQGEQYVYSAGVWAEAKRWIPVGDPLGASSDAPLFMAFSILQPGVVRNVQSNVVTLAVTPPQGTRAYGMEEVVGSGVVVGNISHEGTWDPASRKIRWAFYDGNVRVLSYSVSGPEGLQVSLSGMASFDGSEDPVTGPTHAVIPLTYQAWATAKGLSGDAAAFNAINAARGEANGLLYAFGANLSDSDAIIDIAWINGGPVIETAAQDPATLPFVMLLIEGTSDLTVPADWPIQLEPAADQSGVPANCCRWVPVAAPPGSAFFRVRATIK
jgi:uncharacterized repeat protein (TIGR02543 family)